MFIPPISKNKKWGLRHIWADRIEEIIKLTPGEKVIFTLSNPSFSVLDAVARVNANEIKAIICDGGPFFDIYKFYWNLFTHAFNYNFYFRAVQTLLGACYWNTFLYKQAARKYISKFDNKVPLLSIRAEKDILVTEESIETVSYTHLTLPTKRIV